MKRKTVNIKDIKLSPDNPRYIDESKFKKLVHSISTFPEMYEARPIVVNKDMMVLGGNMRLRACMEVGWTKMQVLIADNFTKEQEQEFVIKDNISFGAWDFDKLANDYDVSDLLDWGFAGDELTGFAVEKEYGGKEIESDSIEDMMSMTLKFPSEEYWVVKEQLDKLSESPEDAIRTLLANG